MSENDRKEKIQAMLLEEVKADAWSWYYISIANPQGFQGAYLIKARGPTEAWTLLHRLGWFPYDTGCDTLTHGPFTEEDLAKVSQEQRWRKLSREEATSLGSS